MLHNKRLLRLNYYYFIIKPLCVVLTVNLKVFLVSIMQKVKSFVTPTKRPPELFRFFCARGPSYCLFVPKMHVGHVVTMSALLKPSSPVKEARCECVCLCVHNILCVCVSVCTSVSSCVRLIVTA